MADGSNFSVELKKIVPIDKRTFNAVAQFINYSTRFKTTVRTYVDVELAKYVYDMSRLVENKSVVRAKYLDISEGELARIFFVPFYAKSFYDWLNDLGQEVDANVKDAKIRKTFKSIVCAIDILHERHVHNIGLKKAIRIDKHDNVQIVLDSMGAVSMLSGIHQDIDDFKDLVDKAFVKAGLTNAVGYGYFTSLYTHLSNRNDVNHVNGSWRSYAYFILHNPLFYEVADRCDCILKLNMFRDMDVPAFDGKICPTSIPDIASWFNKFWKNLKLKSYYQKFSSSRYSTEPSILRFYFDCYQHYDGKKGLPVEVQEKMDRYFPTMIDVLFYFFVERIEVDKMFKNVHVLEYFKFIQPSPNFLN